MRSSNTAATLRPAHTWARPLTSLFLLLLVACGGSGGGHDDDSHPPPTTEARLSLAVQGDGDVESMPSGIADCRATCSAVYAAGRVVTLLATPAGNQRFAGWSGDCGGSDACTLTMDRARSVVARFVAAEAAAPAGSWLQGDLHVHDDHSSDGSLPRQISQSLPGNNPVSAQIGQAERVGLDFLMLTDHRTYDQHYDPLWRSDALLLIPGEEANGSPHATVHGAVDTIVQGANPPGAPDFVNLQQSIWDAHSQDAAWVTAHPDDGETNNDGTPNVRANAQGVDLVEAWNRASNPDAELDYCENRWNAGFRFGVAGASDNHFVELWLIAGPGSPRTQAFVADASERGVLDALRDGRVRITPDARAPIVTLDADADGDGVYEAIAGDEISAAAGTALRLRVRVQNGLGDTVLLYASPGRSAGPLQSLKATQNDQSWTFDVPAGDAPQWYRAEVRGFGLSAGIDTSNLTDPAALTASLKLFDQLRAIASPVFVAPGPVEAQAEIAVPADLGGDDGARRVAGARGRYAGFPDLARSADGTAHLVLETHEPGATRIVYRARGGDGEWRDAPRVLSGDSKSARFPRVAARGAAVFVVWQDEADGQLPRRPQIRLRRSLDGGASWSAIETVRAFDGRAERPVVAVLPDGLPVVAWQEIAPGTPFDVMLQVLGRDAAPQNLSGDGKTLDAGSALDARAARWPASVWPALAVRDDGRIAIAWQDNRHDADPLWTGTTGSGNGTNPDDWQIAVRTRGAGDAGWSALQMIGDTQQADRHPALVYAGDGALFVAWDRKALSSSGANLAVQAARSGDGGANFETAVTLAENAAAMSQYPRLGRDGDGRVRAVWTDSRAADWRWRVMTAVHGSGGWDGGQLLLARGLNTWPATAGGDIVFASTRNAARLQRDRTQQIYVLGPIH